MTIFRASAAAAAMRAGMAAFAITAASVTIITPSLAQTTVLRVTGTGVNAPFNFLEANGNQTGIAVDIIDAVAADLGMTTEYLPTMTVADFPAALVAGTVDVYAGNITVTDARLAQYRMSIPFYLNTGEAAWVRLSDTNDYRTVQDFRGQIVGTLRGGNAVGALEGLGAGFFTEIRQYDNIALAGEAVARGEILAAILGTGTTGRYIIAQGTYPELQVPANYRGTLGFGGVYALPLGSALSDDLVARFNRSLGKLMTNGTVTAIFANYGIAWPFVQ